MAAIQQVTGGRAFGCVRGDAGEMEQDIDVVRARRGDAGGLGVALTHSAVVVMTLDLGADWGAGSGLGSHLTDVEGLSHSLQMTTACMSWSQAVWCSTSGVPSGPVSQRSPQAAMAARIG